MKQCFAIFTGLTALATIALGSNTTTSPLGSKDEQAIWNLEHSYWRYVETNDLTAYSNLWHKNFLGWPSVSSAPVRKDHITDWITSETSKGSTFKTLQFKSAAIQVSEGIAMACYWITFSWLDKNGKGPAHIVRITHAWLRTGDSWQIIGGMSMGEPETPQK